MFWWYSKECQRHGSYYHYIIVREKNLFHKSAIPVGHAIYFLQTSGSSTLALPGALIYCIIQPFSYTKNVLQTSPICGCMSSWSILFNIIKTGLRGGTHFFRLCESNEYLISMGKFCMEAYPQMSFELIVQRKEVHILSYHVPKKPQIFKKITFG